MKIFVWTHGDLDGVVSLLLLKWIMKSNGVNDVGYKTSTPANFRKDYANWLKADSYVNYDKVFILDIDVSNCQDILDHKNISIIDHHANSDVYSLDNASNKSKVYSSCCKLMYDMFKKKFEFTDKQKKLIMLGDDYDSYTLKYDHSMILNYVYWNSDNNFDYFMTRFSDGFDGFNKQEINLYKSKIREKNELINQLDVCYNSSFDIDGVSYKLLSVIADKFINEVAVFLLDKYKYDLIMIANPNKKLVYLRKSEDCKLKLNDLASDYFDGGGHECAAGGKLNDKFLEISKSLKVAK